MREDTAQRSLRLDVGFTTEPVRGALGVFRKPLLTVRVLRSVCSQVTYRVRPRVCCGQFVATTHQRVDWWPSVEYSASGQDLLFTQTLVVKR